MLKYTSIGFLLILSFACDQQSDKTSKSTSNHVIGERENIGAVHDSHNKISTEVTIQISSPKLDSIVNSTKLIAELVSLHDTFSPPDSVCELQSHYLKEYQIKDIRVKELSLNYGSYYGILHYFFLESKDYLSFIGNVQQYWHTDNHTPYETSLENGLLFMNNDGSGSGHYSNWKDYYSVTDSGIIEVLRVPIFHSENLYEITGVDGLFESQICSSEIVRDTLFITSTYSLKYYPKLSKPGQTWFTSTKNFVHAIGFDSDNPNDFLQSMWQYSDTLAKLARTGTHLQQEVLGSIIW